MPKRLLDRQTNLLEYLTSGAAIFGDGTDASLDRAVLGIDAGRLRLEARASHAKRMEKIEWALPRTLDLLGTSRSAIVHDFAEACPPVSIGRLDNARQFHNFLSQCWLREPPKPPYLPDVAACEFAYASIHGRERQAFERNKPTLGGVRRDPSVILVRCTYDVRSVLEGRAEKMPVVKGDTLLAVSMPPAAEHPSISVLSPELFDLLEMLDDFADMTTLSDLPDVNELIADLGRRGLLEVRP
jgi:hypothetical protein